MSMKSSEIRQSFFDFFKSKGHTIVPSCSLLPKAPNLLFTNAGMNPFVPYFLGERKPVHLRVADTQKCIRAGGKHNDLEEVGFDTYHHTFFEMLGNWSFGNYFKKEAIQWAWELLTQVWHFPKKRLYATVYKPQAGDPAQFDQEAYDTWTEIFKKEGMDPQVHVVFGNKKDNFWMMGDTGPCGPCSEIHIDLTPEGDTQGRLVNQGHVRCIEIWNLVFIQYNALPNGKFELLKNKFVDTGMGLERVAGIFAKTQNFSDFNQLPSNYDSDLFTPLFRWLEEKSGCKYTGKVAEPWTENIDADILKDCAFRIIADHVRTLSFAIADGILPGNEGRNYVLRRIIRRAILFGQKLQLPAGFFAELSSVVVGFMGDFFPELRKSAPIIQKVLQKEEKAFMVTLNRGLRLFERWAEASPQQLSGEAAFLLFDTYGFPIDLTQLIAKERHMSVDMEGFYLAMQQQKERSKVAQKKSIIQLTKSSDKSTRFVGYDPVNLNSWQTTLLSVCENQGKVYLTVESSPFYGEKGGQAGDSGYCLLPNDKKIPLQSTHWHQQSLLHEVDGVQASDLLPFIGQTVTLSVDIERRKAIARHHTATHLLQWALRKVLGPHVHQTGSQVNEHGLRFDFSHFEKLSEDQLQQIERLCNERIVDNAVVVTEEVDYDKRPQECLSFFEDKYGDRVRVVHVGDFSVELCGGTHVKATGELGQIKIVQEAAIASGVRRVEAVAGLVAYEVNRDRWNQCQCLELQIGCSIDKVFEKYRNLEAQKKTVDGLYRQLLLKNIQNCVQQAHMVNGLQCVQLQIMSVDMNTLRSLGKSYFSNNHVDILLAASEMDGKGFLTVFCSDRAINQKVNTDVVFQKLLKPLGANGGGKPDFATGGLKDLVHFKAAWNQLKFDL